MSGHIKSYKDLVVWQKSMDLVILIYKLTEKFPKNERFGLISQMRRAGVSIPSNIAEGSRRKTNKARGQFFTIAFGSGSELETQLEISSKLKYTEVNEYKKAGALLNEVMRMLNKMLENWGIY